MSGKAISLLWIIALYIYLCSGQRTAVDFMESISNNKNIKLPPSSSSKKATEVQIGLYINNFHVDNSMKMTLTMYFRNKWTDERLKFTSADYDGQDTIRLPDDAYKKIWIPDLFSRNAISYETAESRRINQLLTVSSSGSVWFVSMIKATYHCPFRLQKYPFDTQTCLIMFESFGDKMDVQYYTWLDNPTDVDPSINLPTFTLKDFILNSCNQNYTAGAFPCLEIRFVLSRDSGEYIMKVYLPSVVLVILSFFAFWMDAKLYSHRIATLILLSIALLGLYIYSTFDLPKVSYAKAIDIWFYVCLIFVLMATVESTIVKMLSSSTDDKKSGACTCPRVVRLLDSVSRIAAPSVFLLFIIIYSSIYSAA